MGPIYWCPTCNDHFDIKEMPGRGATATIKPPAAATPKTTSTTRTKKRRTGRSRLNVCITGRLPSGRTREQMVNLLENAGHTFHKTVKSTTHVLIREENHLKTKSSKTRSAENLGILILSEKEFEDEYM
jgi:NAD-dependent DNA ligase